ncbi:MAG: hypothetical protein KGZ81_11695 [Flavobacteriales bacterium]|nr:hypothetical protein [Flavobacteriales bacterium]
MKTQYKIPKRIYKEAFLILTLCMAMPLYADDPGIPGSGDPGDEPMAPISDYWWALVLIGIYFIYKKYRVLQKQA